MHIIHILHIIHTHNTYTISGAPHTYIQTYMHAYYVCVDVGSSLKVQVKHAPRCEFTHSDMNSRTLIRIHAPRYEFTHPHTNSRTPTRTHALQHEFTHPNTKLPSSGSFSESAAAAAPRVATVQAPSNPFMRTLEIRT